MTVVEILGILGTAGGMAWGGWKKVVQPIVKKSKARRLEREEDRKKLDYLVKEMTVDENGSMKTKVVNMATDIEHLKNNQRQMVDRLEEIDENQKLSMNLQGVRYWVSDSEGDWTYVSPDLCKFLGRSESELLGRNWLAVVVQEDRVRVNSAVEFSAKTESSFDEIFTIRRPDQHIVKVWAVALPKAGKKILGGTMGKMTPMEPPHLEKTQP